MKIKHLNILSFIILFSFNTSISQAQFKKVGLKTGINISNVRITNGDFSTLVEQDDFQNLTGFNIGFLSQVSSNEIFVTDFSFLYSAKGCTDDNYKLRLHYLKMPLVFKIRIPITGPVSLQGGFGPYIEYAFMAKETIDGTTNEDILSLSRTEDSEFFSGDIKEYFPLSAGISFGGDVEMSLPNDCFLQLSVNYELGIGKITNDWAISTDSDGNTSYVNPALKNNSICINVAYLFDVTKNKNSNSNSKSSPNSGIAE